MQTFASLGRSGGEGSLRVDGLAAELVPVELRTETDVAEEVFANELSLVALEDGADQEPGLGVDEQGLLGDALFLGLLVAGPLQHEALAAAGLLDLLPAE